MTILAEDHELDVPPLFADDTCDKCGPATRALASVRLTSGHLLTFCWHCWLKYGPAMHNKNIVLSVFTHPK